jgi:hypothetical protein
MWDVLTRDYNPGSNPGAILARIFKYTGAGSIVVFHDSHKALAGLKLFLEPFLKHFSQLGFRFESLADIS